MKEAHSSDLSAHADAWRDRFAGTHLLITGGLGFIGSRLAARLVEYGAHVTILDNLAPNTGANRFNVAAFEDRMRIVIGDIRDRELVTQLVRGQDVIFNLAALIAHMEAMRSPIDDLDVNARAQLILLDACRDTNPAVRIVHASTRQIYGRAMRLPVAEDHPARPIDVNGVNKLAGEQFHLMYHDVYGTRSTVLRLTNTYGPGMRIADGRQTFIGVWVRAIVEQEPFEVWGGSQLRDLVFVEDAVDAFCAAAVSDVAVGQAYNVGGAEPVTLLALADRLVASGCDGSYNVIPYPDERRAIEIGDFSTDCAKIANELGWHPRTTLDVGLARTVAYYLANYAQYL